jgi:pre-mRNA cleavage complex 2 protein Pcf11
LPLSLSSTFWIPSLSIFGCGKILLLLFLLLFPPQNNNINNKQNDGMLILSKSLRREMQNILDDMQSDVQNELEKVSLERLADINPDLLANIKNAAAEETSNTGGAASGGKHSSSDAAGGASSSSKTLVPFLTETRTDDVVARSTEWGKVDIVSSYEAVVSSLVELCAVGDTSSTNMYTKQEAIEMTGYLATASALAQLIASAGQEYKAQQSRHQEAATRSARAAENSNNGTSTGNKSTSVAALAVNPEDFTPEGIKRKNAAAVALLYEIGLPFVSSADGRRFRTQLDLSKHLDALFRRNQIAKTIAATEERGYYVSDSVWTRDAKEDDVVMTDTGGDPAAAPDDDGDGEGSDAVVADETRDRCVVCGIHFQMFFDNDDGVYKYRNSREIEVLNDDAADTESELHLVHVSCWKGLGMPTELTVDQTLQDTTTLRPA